MYTSSKLWLLVKNFTSPMGVYSETLKMLLVRSLVLTTLPSVKTIWPGERVLALLKTVSLAFISPPVPTTICARPRLLNVTVLPLANVSKPSSVSVSDDNSVPAPMSRETLAATAKVAPILMVKLPARRYSRLACDCVPMRVRVADWPLDRLSPALMYTSSKLWLLVKNFTSPMGVYSETLKMLLVRSLVLTTLPSVKTIWPGERVLALLKTVSLAFISPPVPTTICARPRLLNVTVSPLANVSKPSSVSVSDDNSVPAPMSRETLAATVRVAPVLMVRLPART